MKKARIITLSILALCITAMSFAFVPPGGTASKASSVETAAEARSRIPGNLLDTVKKKNKEPLAPAVIQVAEEADYNNNGIIISGTRAMELFGYNFDMLQRYAANINAIAQKVPESVNVYSMLVPTAVEFYSPVKYHTGARSEKDAIYTTYSMFVPSVKGVDAYAYLAGTADQYVYFRTDHHWTGRGAHQGYYAFCAAADLPSTDIENRECRIAADSFTGTLYTATKAQILADNPDYVEVFTPPQPESCTAYTAADMKTPYGCALLIDPSASSNKYMAFLGGDHPLVHIVTKYKNGRRLLMLKDSFGNALTTLLVNNYEELYIMDPRATQTDIGAFCEEHKIDDLLIENYMFGIGISDVDKGLKAMVQNQ